MQEVLRRVERWLWSYMLRSGFTLPCCSDAPDTSGMNRAAEANADVAREALAFYRQAYYEQAPMRERAAATADEVSDQALASARQNDAISRDYWDYQKNTFRPLEGGIVADASRFDTPARRESAAAAAAATMGTAMAQQRQAATMRNATMGVNPNSGRQQALDAQADVMGAAATAGTMNDARDRIELQGYARRMDAAGLGRNLATNQATSAQVALSGGTTAVNAAGVPIQQAQSATQMAGQGFTTAIQGNQSAGGLYGQAAQIQQQADSSMWNGLGQAAGMGIALYKSDRAVKRDIKPVDDDDALGAIERMPVSSWQYDPAKGGPDDGGKTHIGPMAQDVQAAAGDGAAPGGKQIDLVSLNGIALKGIQEVNRKVEKLAQAVRADMATRGTER